MTKLSALLLARCHSAACLMCRDLKLDNALLDKSKPPVLKLCDFGFARAFGAHGHRLERVNSHLGCAPLTGGCSLNCETAGPSAQLHND